MGDEALHIAEVSQKTSEDEGWRRFSALTTWIWLAFLVPPLLRRLTDDAMAPGPRLAILVVMLVFVVVYCWLFYRHGPGTTHVRTQVCGATGLALLLGVIGLLSPGLAFSAVPYLVAYVAYVLPHRVSLPVLAVILPVIWWVPIQFRHLGWFVTILSVGLAVSGVLMSILLARLTAREDLERRNLVLSERDRLSSDVHDLVGHSLTVVSLKTQLVEKLLETDPARARAELSDIRSILAESLAGVRQTVADQRPTALQTELTVAVSSLSSAGLEVDVLGGAELACPEHGPTLAWVVREASTNTLRHARAKHVRIEVRGHRFSFVDDGVGTSGMEGSGISGMRRRVLSAGGVLDIRAPGHGGTVVEVTW